MTALIEAVLAHPRRWLATYATLSPGGENHHLLERIEGTWSSGAVRGQIIEEDGLLVLDPVENGPSVPVRVLHSEGLDEVLTRLDAFEGVRYRQALIPIDLDAGTIIGVIYAKA